jgi:hypothetical protein
VALVSLASERTRSARQLIARCLDGPRRGWDSEARGVPLMLINRVADSRQGLEVGTLLLTRSLQQMAIQGRPVNPRPNKACSTERRASLARFRSAVEGPGAAADFA